LLDLQSDKMACILLLHATKKLTHYIDLSPGKQEDFAMRTKTIIAIFAGVLLTMLIGFPPQIDAEMNVSIGIGVPVPQVVIPAPPPVVVHTPPPMVVIPGTYIYFAPDVGVDMFFYHGYWYRPHHGYWYRAKGYNGPWHGIEGGKVPHVVRNVPSDFRYTVRHHERIRHVDLQRNWKTWEQKKHWDRPDVRSGQEGPRRDGNNHGRPDYRHDDRDVRSENHGKPDTRHDVREARDDRRSGGDQLRLGGGGRPEEVREVRNDRDRGKQEKEQGKPEGKGKHDR
jgi:hypothetical protein